MTNWYNYPAGSFIFFQRVPLKKTGTPGRQALGVLVSYTYVNLIAVFVEALITACE